MDSENLGRRAAEIGLDLNPQQRAQLARATALAQRLAARLPRDLPLDAEPALVLRLRRRVAQ